MIDTNEITGTNEFRTFIGFLCCLSIAVISILVVVGFSIGYMVGRG